MNKLYVVSIGPGNEEGMTLKARRVLDECGIIAGYKTYIELVRPILKDDKTYIDTGMRQEADRCRMALDAASKGDTPVCIICSGDACVYGMAGLVFELSVQYKNVEIEVIPGVTAALSGSALLGAALGHDLAVISLSDLLTPREVIEKRLRGAGQGDFAISIYNPASKTRKDHLRWACEILLEYRSPDTVCGLVRNIGREGESVRVLTLANLKDAEADMFTTVFIGNSRTLDLDGHMVTPRGYEL